jgi:hypothetical protein
MDRWELGRVPHFQADMVHITLVYQDEEDSDNVTLRDIGSKI